MSVLTPVVYPQVDTNQIMDNTKQLMDVLPFENGMETDMS